MDESVIPNSTRPAPLLSEEEAAKLLGMKKQTLANWRTNGVGPKFVKVGGRSIRYKLSELLAFIEDRTFNSTTEAMNAKL